MTCLALVAGAGACAEPDRECEKAEEHCASGVAYTCDEYQSGHGSGSRWAAERCAGSDECKTDQYGAFCTVNASPDPQCAGQNTTYCSNAKAVTCRAGFSIDWSACATCSADGTACENGVGTYCGATGACPPGLLCEDFCRIPCPCADGAACPACGTFSEVAGYSWTCKNDVCQSVPTPL